MAYSNQLHSLVENFRTLEGDIQRQKLALIYCYDQFNSHVYGRKIEYYTDHEPLVTMRKLKKPLGRLRRLFH